MLKKSITYTDYDGNERTEDFYFNLSKIELVEMQMSEEGGLESYIHQIVDAKDMKKLIELFKELVLKAYGVRSEDGRRFIKDPELTKEFSQTAAFNEIFMELATNENEAVAFVNGIVPQNMK
jgi:hypothetical protein